MTTSGIPALDELLGGDGYPEKSTVLLTGPPGIGKEALGYWFTQSGLGHDVLVEIVSATVFLYASYWAFVIRRASAVHLYRNQALGVFLIAVSIGLVSLGFALTGGGGLPINIIFAAMANVFLFYWVDVSLSAARRSDPLLRDTARWSRLRVILWPIVIVAIPFVAFVRILPLAHAFLIYGVGALVLSWAAGRSKDLTLRRHLKWFGAYAISQVVFYACLGVLLTGVIASGSTIALALFPVISGASLGGAYSLYRSATSLVPLRPLPEGVRFNETN